MTPPRRAPQIWDDYAERHDAWYERPPGKVLFALEAACLQPLLHAFPQPYLEVGVGTGRFAQALDVAWGLDPSYRALKQARHRGIKAVLGVGEALPFKDATFGGMLLASTLCFVQDPDRVLQEVRRVVVPGGGVVLGLLLKSTPWADWYAQRGAMGHPLYRTAHFYEKEEVESFLERAGFHITGCRSTLFHGPQQNVYQEERVVPDFVPGAGFVAIAAVKTDAHPDRVPSRTTREGADAIGRPWQRCRNSGGASGQCGTRRG